MDIKNINLNEETEYRIQDDSEIKYDKKTRQLYWDIAIGLNDVDNLKPSEYFKALIHDNVEGHKNNYEIEYAIKEYYKEKLARQSVNESEMQCDLVSLRIKELLDDESFTFSPITLKSIHKHLFKDVFDFAGKFRDYNISKDEIILNGDTVKYTNYDMIDDTLSYDFSEEKKFNYSKLTLSQQIDRLMEFISSIWQVHPFGEGNTRTTAVFLQKYLASKGYKVTNDSFKENSLYFRNALVRANYANYPKGVYPEFKYLRLFMENLLMNKNHELKNRNLLVEELFDEKI